MFIVGVESDKYFASPIKKLKVDKDDLVGEEHNADSGTKPSDREIFDKWCKFSYVPYKDEEEKEYRFRDFQRALKLPNCPGLADLLEGELNVGSYAYIFNSDIEMMDELVELFPQSEEFDGYITKSEKDAVAEEDNIDSNPKVTNLSDREIFDKWCKFYQVTYKDEEEKEYRFGNFQKALKPPKTRDELQPNFPGLADIDEGELHVGSYAYIFQSDIELMDELDGIFSQSEEELDLCITKSEKDSVAEEDNTDSNPKVTNLSDREIFDKWCKFYQVTYKDEEEKEYRFGNFQKALKPPKTRDELQPNFPGLADIDEGELHVGSYAYIFQSDIELMDELDGIFSQSEEELDFC